MGQLVSITRKPVTVQGYQLQAPADMFAALDYVSNGNYAGTINLTKNNGVKTYELTVYSLTTNNSQRGVVGSWVIIENSSVVKIVSDAEFTAMYTNP